jgi:hypothetical protein
LCDAAQVSTAFSDYVFWPQLKTNVNINFETCHNVYVSPWSFYQIAGKGAASGWLAGLLAGERARARAICFMGARQLIGLPGLECKWQNV